MRSSHCLPDSIPPHRSYSDAVHAWHAGEAGYKSAVPPIPLSAMTSAGITTVIGLLGTDDEVRDAPNTTAHYRHHRPSSCARTGSHTCTAAG